MATRLGQLKIDEVSGVASPANELPGWLVMKSAGDELDAEALLKEVDRMESDIAILYSALTQCEPYLADAPEEVQAASQTLKAFLETMFQDPSLDGGTPDAGADMAGDPNVAASVDGEPLTGVGRLLNRLVSTKKSTKTEEKLVEEPKQEPAEKAKPAEQPKLELPAELTKALEDVASGMQALSQGQESIREALSLTVDRVSQLETTRKAVEYDIEPVTVPTEKSADRSTAALRSVLVDVALNPGKQVRLG
jgi:hypothetical protein